MKYEKRVEMIQWNLNQSSTKKGPDSALFTVLIGVVA